MTLPLGTSSLGEKEKWAAAFEGLRKERFRSDPSWLSKRREEALACFLELDFPTTKHEEWRYTNVTSLVSTPWAIQGEAPSEKVGPEDLRAFTFGEAEWTTLVFVNGFYSKELSSFAREDKRVVVTNLSEALRSHSDLIEKHLGRYVRHDRNAFTALNAALAQDGAFIYVPEGVVVEKPIHLLFTTLCTRVQNVVAQPRNLVVAGKGSRFTLIESYVSPTGGSYFTNTVTEVVLEEGARVEHYKLQRESEEAFHLATMQVQHERGSSFASSLISIGAKLARTQLAVVLFGEGAEASLDGLYLARERQHVDHTVFLDHAKPQGTSRQLFKGILDGKSTAVFSGKIFVREGAQKTDAEQINKNLLLSQEATANTKPQLEIFNDDVKCTHGAAVGQLEELPMFYLRSRGMSPEAARNLLTHGFASEVIQRIKVKPIGDALEEFLWAWLEK